MIPLWNEDSVDAKNWASIGAAYERCVFCSKAANTWHENTNNPICTSCAKVKKVSEIPEDHGQRIRANKRSGKFSRGDATRAN